MHSICIKKVYNIIVLCINVYNYLYFSINLLHINICNCYILATKRFGHQGRDVTGEASAVY